MATHTLYNTDQSVSPPPTRIIWWIYSQSRRTSDPCDQANAEQHRSSCNTLTTINKLSDCHFWARVDKRKELHRHTRHISTVTATATTSKELHQHTRPIYATTAPSDDIQTRDGSIYRKYRYIVSISIYRIIEYRPLQYRKFRDIKNFDISIFFRYIDSKSAKVAVMNQWI